MYVVYISCCIIMLPFMSWFQQNGSIQWKFKVGCDYLIALYFHICCLYVHNIFSSYVVHFYVLIINIHMVWGWMCRCGRVGVKSDLKKKLSILFHFFQLRTHKIEANIHVLNVHIHFYNFLFASETKMKNQALAEVMGDLPFTHAMFLFVACRKEKKHANHNLKLDLMKSRVKSQAVFQSWNLSCLCTCMCFYID